MSEVVQTETDVIAPEMRASVETAGAMLRSARERAGLHVAALAVSMKVPVKKLEALEADQLQGTDDLVFTRALAASVCRTLKIDPTPILAALPQTVVRELHVDDHGINAPFQASVSGGKLAVASMVQPWTLLVAALCVGAIAIAVSGWFTDKEDASTPLAPTAAEGTAPLVAAPVVIPSVDTAQGEVKPMATTAPVITSAMDAVSSPGSSGLASTPSSTVLTPVAVPEMSVVAAGSETIMGFVAKNQSVWVEVIDSKGEVRLRRNVAAGERVTCGGVPPLAVVVGRADAMDVEVRGKPYSISAFARDNVARFEVK